MEDDKTPWDQRPGYVAAIATEVAPGGLTAYRVPRPKGWSSTDVTTFMPGQAEWSTENFSDILYQLKPTNAWFEFKKQGLPPQMEDEHGNLITEPFPEPGVKPRPLLNFPILPSQISTRETPAFFETVRRWDPRVRWEDITMRMEIHNRPADNTVQMRGTRYFRSTHNMIAWHSYSEGGRHHKLSGKRETVLQNLSAEQIAANTTRGTTPGPISPELGEAGGFVPFPILSRGQGEARKPRTPGSTPKPKCSSPAATSGQPRKVGRPRGRPRKIKPLPIPIISLLDCDDSKKEAALNKLVDYDDSEKEAALNKLVDYGDSEEESQTTNVKTNTSSNGNLFSQSQTANVNTNNSDHGYLFLESRTEHVYVSNSNKRKKPDDISLSDKPPRKRKHRYERHPFVLPKTEQEEFVVEDPELGQIIPRPNFWFDHENDKWVYFDIENQNAAPPKTHTTPPRMHTSSLKVHTSFPKLHGFSPKMLVSPPETHSSPPRVNAAFPRVVECPYSPQEDSSVTNPPMTLEKSVTPVAQMISTPPDDFDFDFDNNFGLPSQMPDMLPEELAFDKNFGLNYAASIDAYFDFENQKEWW